MSPRGRASTRDAARGFPNGIGRRSRCRGRRRASGHLAPRRTARWRCAPFASTSPRAWPARPRSPACARRGELASSSACRRSAVGAGSPVSRSAIVPSTPCRHAGPAVLLDAPGGRVGRGSPASWRSARRRERLDDGRRPPPRRPRSSACPARAPRGCRTGCGRSSHHHCAAARARRRHAPARGAASSSKLSIGAASPARQQLR